MPDHFTDENEGEPVAELVQRLRGRADWYDDAHPGTVKTPQVLREAASTIERLQRELDEARAAKTYWESFANTLQNDVERLVSERDEALDALRSLNAHWNKAGEEVTLRATAAEASLVKAREALKPFAAMRLSTEPGVSDLVLRSPADEMRRQAEAVEAHDRAIRAARAILGTRMPFFRFPNKDDTRFVVSFDGGAVLFDGPFWLSDENAIERAKRSLPLAMRELANPTVQRGDAP